MTKERNKIYNVTKLVSFAFSFNNESNHGNCYEYQVPGTTGYFATSQILKFKRSKQWWVELFSIDNRHQKMACTLVLFL